MHPDLQVLMGFRDGELSPERETEVRQHVGLQPLPRQLSAHARLLWNSGAGWTIDAWICGPQGGNRAVGGQMGETRTERRGPTDAYDRPCEERAGRNSFAQSAATGRPADNRDLFATVEPVLEEFLGPGAASALID